VDEAFDGVASMLETDALGSLNIQSVAFSMSPPYRTMISAYAFKYSGTIYQKHYATVTRERKNKNRILPMLPEPF